MAQRNLWTDEQINKLIELRKNKIPYKEISKIVNHSICSINYKLSQLNFEKPIFPNDAHFTAIYQNRDWLYQKYVVEGLNHDEMAKEAGCTKRVIEKWCEEKYSITQKYRQQNKQLNDKQKDLIIGSMLGDGHIDRRKTQPIFIVSHAENQKDYLYFKYDILKDLCNIPPVKKNSNYRKFGTEKVYLCKPAYRMCTRIYDCLLEYRDRTYSDLLKLLNEFSLSVWILDDGYRCGSNWELCVAEYTNEDIATAFNIFKKRFGLIATRDKDKRYIHFDAESSRKLDGIILKNIPNNLDIIQYKLINNTKIKKRDLLDEKIKEAI